MRWGFHSDTASISTKWNRCGANTQAMNPIDPKRPGSTRLRRAKARSSGKTLANANRDGKKNSQT